MNIGLNTISAAGNAAGLFGGSGAASAAKTAQDAQSLQKFDDLLETAKNSAKSTVKNTQKNDSSIDKSSTLYQKAQDLETFFVKIMLSSMRNTVTKINVTGNNDYAQKIYDDMLYDEYADSLTKNAGFGLADQVYKQLANY